MISMRVVLLIATMVVNGLGAKNTPAELTELYDAATESCSIPQETSKRIATSPTYNETTRSKRQIPCCYDNPYPIITLPSCSIPYTIINGTCYLATCPKPCSIGGVGHTVTCCTDLNPAASPEQHRDEHVPTSHQPTAQQQQQQPLNHIDNVKKTQSGANSTENSGAPGGANNTINTMETPVPPKPLPNYGFTTEESTDSPKLEKLGSGSASTTTTEESIKNTTSTGNETLSSTTTSMVPTIEKEPGKHEPHFCCVSNSAARNVSESNKTECEICQCYCTPVNCDLCPDVQPSNDTSGCPASSCNLANFNPDFGCLGCNNHYSPISGCRCSFCNNMSTRPMKETAGLMKCSGNGKGGNTIVSSMNILAGPSCADPCCNQNACMLSHSGNGDGGNKIIANTNYINGGNLLCCSGNGKGGNCIRSMINIIGGNSAHVLSSCDGKLLKHLCDFMMAVDDCSSSGCTRNITDNKSIKPTTEPTNKTVDETVNNTYISPRIDAPIISLRNDDSQKPLTTEVAPSDTLGAEDGVRSSRTFLSRDETDIQPIDSALTSALVGPSPRKLTCDRHQLLNHRCCCRRRSLSPNYVPNYVLVPNNYRYC